MKTIHNGPNEKVLIAFFSRPGKNYVNGNIADLPVGNTEIVAKKILEITGGDLFRIESVDMYPSDYEACTEIAKRELNSSARPKLARRLEGTDTYDVIFLGFPNWWGTMPMPVFTFLEENDLSGKTIVPFCTHEGSGMGRSVTDIKKMCPRSTVLNGLAIRGGEAKNSLKEIEEWTHNVRDR